MATIYELEKRLSNLENLVDYLSKQMTNTKEYADADMAGARQGISEVTPTTFTKTAYIGDTEVVFTDVPSGNLTVFTDNLIEYTMAKDNDRVTISFEPLTEVTTITISIL